MKRDSGKRFKARPGGKRYLKCESCGNRGVEIAKTIPRRRKSVPAKSLPCKVKRPLGKSEIGHRMQNSPDAAARGMKGTTMLFSIFQLGRKLDLTWHDVYDRVVDGDIPLSPLYVGTYARWPVAAVESWIAGGCQPGEELSDADFSRLQTALLAELQELDTQKGTVR